MHWPDKRQQPGCYPLDSDSDSGYDCGTLVAGDSDTGSGWPPHQDAANPQKVQHTQERQVRLRLLHCRLVLLLRPRMTSALTTHIGGTC